MHHVIAPAPPRSRRGPADRSRPAPRTSRLTALDVVSLHVLAGFLGPLPVIQLGHLLFGWPSVAVMIGGQGDAFRIATRHPHYIKHHSNHSAT